MIQIYLSKDEEYLLHQHFSKSPITSIRLKSQCVLMRNREMRYKDISYFLTRKERTLKLWVSNYSKFGISSIFSKKIDNENASKLTNAQKLEVSKTLQQPPSECGLPREFWDVPTLKNYVKAEFGIKYESKQSYHCLLKFSSLSFKYPDKFDIKRDEEQIEKRIAEIHKELKPYWSNKEYLIFASDETRVQLETLTRRAWLKKGKKTVIKVSRKKEAQNYIGFLNLKSGRNYTFRLKWQNQEEIIRSIKRLLAIKEHKSRRIIIIWDNAPFHKGKLIKEQLTKGKALHNIHLINLPPYAPDKNPVEQVWNVAKNRISNTQYKDFNTTKEKFEFYSRSYYNYKI
jgi:transposase